MKRDYRSIAFGIFYMLAGGWFLLNQLGYWDVDASYLGPIFLAAFGALTMAIGIWGRRDEGKQRDQGRS